MTEPTNLPVSDYHHVPSVFVNQVAGSGILNGVVNVTFATAQFTPSADGRIDPDLMISARLRMDLACAQQLHQALGRILEANLRPANASTN